MPGKAKVEKKQDGERKPRKESKPKNVIHLSTKLRCQRCEVVALVEDLNPERKAVHCPVCGEYNDIREAQKRAA